jgi:hypothetical protein
MFRGLSPLPDETKLDTASDSDEEMSLEGEEDLLLAEWGVLPRKRSAPSLREQCHPTGTMLVPMAIVLVAIVTVCFFILHISRANLNAEENQSVMLPEDMEVSKNPFVHNQRCSSDKPSVSLSIRPPQPVQGSKMGCDAPRSPVLHQVATQPIAIVGKQTRYLTVRHLGRICTCWVGLLAELRSGPVSIKTV